jgi:hypothetical protein
MLKALTCWRALWRRKLIPTFLQENPTLVPLYEIDVVKELKPYQISDEAGIVELCRAREALERELAVSQRVRPTELEKLNLGTA